VFPVVVGEALLQGMEGEVFVAELRRTPHLECLLRAHDLGGRDADRGDALAVAQSLRGDRGRLLAVEDFQKRPTPISPML
jgi:hypothetical protein